MIFRFRFVMAISMLAQLAPSALQFLCPSGSWRFSSLHRLLSISCFAGVLKGAAADRNPCGPAFHLEEQEEGAGGVRPLREGVRLRNLRSHPFTGNRRRQDWWKRKMKHMQAFDGRVAISSRELENLRRARQYITSAPRASDPGSAIRNPFTCEVTGK